MISSQPPCVWIVDPGLMEAGGHHAALAETLCQSQLTRLKVKQTPLSINVFAHNQLDKGVNAKLVDVGIQANLHFESVFYRHFHDGSKLGPAGIQGYVRRLSDEYFQVLEKAIAQSENKRTVLFYPCLNWEHAWALSIAIEKCGSSVHHADLYLVCCAMYAPSDATQFSSKQMWYKLGFQRLTDLPFLTLYCSEYELCQAYQDLLNCTAIIAHPCYLMDWSSVVHQTNDCIAPEIPENTVLLYLGDAKEDKGFNRLPELLGDALANTADNTHFLIQFTLAWAYPELTESINRLKKWAEKEPRLILHQGFWSNDQLAIVMRRIKVAVCTYDTHVYQNKSSGLLWMLAYFERPLIVDGPCWLTREAKRMGVAHQVDPKLNVPNVPLDKCIQNAESLSYRQSMFEPLTNWLVNH